MKQEMPPKLKENGGVGWIKLEQIARSLPNSLEAKPAAGSEGRCFAGLVWHDNLSPVCFKNKIIF